MNLVVKGRIFSTDYVNIRLFGAADENANHSTQKGVQKRDVSFLSSDGSSSP